MFPERAAAADLVFPQPRLRFVNAERGGAAERLAEMAVIQPLIVDAVSRLVQGPEERLVEVPRVVARGQARISGADAAAKGMCRRVKAAGGKVEADGGSRLLAEEPLTIHGKLALEDLVARPLARANDRANERHEVFAQGREQLGDLRGRRPGLVFLQKCIVGRLLVADRLS